MAVVPVGSDARRTFRRSASTARSGQASAAPLQRTGQSHRRPQFILMGYLASVLLGRIKPAPRRLGDKMEARDEGVGGKRSATAPGWWTAKKPNQTVLYARFC